MQIQKTEREIRQKLKNLLILKKFVFGFNLFIWVSFFLININWII
jgi:hypothetical protein